MNSAPHVIYLFKYMLTGNKMCFITSTWSAWQWGGLR